ncbi:thermonuclease family protein [Candidatus Uabimicrobium amorphum]|uniref:Thermonuclease n=1 Tax=Uabimicrobium amorphum TaxID=2596890 RepID=A0A5S9IRX3_UABAM|nr:thermonuclease family protein [Candidatus Uabimicrobium amorphum]BBM87028.1 thermonuclease [Candidatus Uabimicrobium amorphum]
MKTITLFLIFGFLVSCGPKEVHVYNDEQKQKTVDKTNLVIVKKVISGDSIELEDGRIVKYIHVTAPQKGEKHFDLAKDANTLLVVTRAKNKVFLEFGEEKRDQDGRYLAYVFAPTPLLHYCFVNKELIEYGYAKVTATPPNKKYLDLFLSSEQRAKTKQLNIWKP